MHLNSLCVCKMDGSKLQLSHIFKLPYKDDHTVDPIRALHDARPVSSNNTYGLFSLEEVSLLRFCLEIFDSTGYVVSNPELVIFNYAVHQHMQNEDAHTARSGVTVIPWEVWGRSGVALGVRATAPDGYHDMWPSEVCGCRLLDQDSNDLQVFDFHPRRVQAAMMSNLEGRVCTVYDGPIVLEARFSATGENIITNIPFLYTRTPTVAPMSRWLNWPRAPGSP
jgi:hypothetical protein